MLSIEKPPYAPAVITIDPKAASLGALKSALLKLDIESYEDTPNQGVILRMGNIEANVKRPDLINVILGLQLAEQIKHAEGPEREAPASQTKNTKNP